MPEENKNNYNFIVCPQCHGSGKKNLLMTCDNCQGMGAGSFYEGKFYYWGMGLSPAMIELSRFRRWVEGMINFAIFIFGIAGIGALAWWQWTNSNLSNHIAFFTFWKFQHPLLLLFWLGAAADLFVFYRLSEQIRKSRKIKKIPRSERDQEFDIPDNWQGLIRAKDSLKIDVATGYSLKAVKAVEDAFLLADSANHEALTVIHLFISCLKDREVAALFSRLNVDGSALVAKLKKRLSLINAAEQGIDISEDAKQALVNAYLYALGLGQKKVEPLNLVLPSIMVDHDLYEILYDLEVDENKINNVVIWFEVNKKLVEGYKRYQRAARFKPATAMDRAYTAVATPILNRLAYDLTVAAKWSKLELCVGREAEIEKIFEQFESGHNAVIITGPPGVGKSAVLDGIAQLMVEEDVPYGLKDKRLVELDIARLVSGASPADAEERLLAAVSEVMRAGNIVLGIRNVEGMAGITAGSEESLDLSEVLVSAIERQGFYCIATATDRNYTRYIENASLGGVMARVEIKEPSGNQAVQIIESKIGAIEGRYGVYFSYNAIEQVIALTSRYIHDKYLPEKAIKVLESVAVRVAKTKGSGGLVTKEEIAACISETTRIPTAKITESEGEKLLKLEDDIHKRMVDQEEAVKMVSSALRRARTEIREGKRPIANFLFLGPTGVGKTELAKSVSEVYFGDEQYMIRIDMSEYQHADSIEKMIGSPGGTLGYLTEAVRKAPFSLILLDEFEKAHPEILNLFLQVMEDGRLTDGQGRTIDFTSSIIIATSNAGAVFIQEQIFAGKGIGEFKEDLINNHLLKIMRPELVNRFDGVIVFEPLALEDVVEITRLLLNKTGKMLADKGIGMRVEEEAVRELASLGFDPKFGARPLRRLLQDKVDDAIASKILAGELRRRDTVYIDVGPEIKVIKAPEL